MRVAVVIPCRNGGTFLPDAIESALAEGVAEVVLVDDGSSEDLSPIRATFEGRVHWITQPPLGVSAARNTGWQATDAEAVLFLDADDRLRSGTVSRRQAMLAEGAGAVCGNALFWDEGLAIRQGVGRSLERTTLGFRDVVRQNPGGASGCLVLREALERCGGFDPVLQRAEDWDLIIRIASRYPVVYDNEPGVDVRVRADSLTAAAEGVYRSACQVLLKAVVYAPSRRQAWLDGHIARFHLALDATQRLGPRFVAQHPEAALYQALRVVRFVAHRVGRGRGGACASS